VDAYAEAVVDYPYCLRLAAMECLCPLNNVRLLCENKEHPKQCRLNQLANRVACVKCVDTQLHSSGGLHAAERRLAGFDESNYGERLKASFENAHSVLVVNNQIAALVEPYANDVRVIPSGFDIQRFDNLPPRARGDRPFRILFAGLVEEYMKGFHVLLAACRDLWKQRQDFELWITTENCAASDPFIRQCGWQTQTDLPHTMAQCDVVAVPTVAQEALGRTAVEAMGASRAVIASSLGGLKEVVCDGLTGILVKPADPADLMRGLIKLIDLPEMTEQFGKNGRMRFESIYPWSTIIERHYLPLFETCRRRR
jgi:glycosyltransferase involved in cell wall biosynthesis